MKFIKVVVRNTFSITDDAHKIVAVIMKLIDYDEQINKLSIKNNLANQTQITGFNENISFESAYNMCGLVEEENIVALKFQALLAFNKIYKQKLTLEALERM